jgi:copper(I)-binding protein
MIAAIFRMASRMSCLAVRAFALAGTMVVAIGIASAETDGAIAVENAWSRAVPEGATVGVGYLAIRNESDVPDRLVSASASLAGETEIHQTTMDDGVMRIRRFRRCLCRPKARYVGTCYHFMFMGLTAAQKAIPSRRN